MAQGSGNAVPGQPAVTKNDATNASDKEELHQKAVGWFLKKSFGGVPFLGRVFCYDAEENWYRVRYEDGDLEDLTWSEIKDLLLPERANAATAKTVERMSPDRKAHLFDDTDGFEEADKRLAQERSPPPSRRQGRGTSKGRGKGQPRKVSGDDDIKKVKKSSWLEELSDDDDGEEEQESGDSNDSEDEVVVKHRTSERGSGRGRGRGPGRGGSMGRGTKTGRGTKRGRGRVNGKAGGKQGTSGAGSMKSDFYYGDDYAEEEEEKEDVWEQLQDEDDEEEEEGQAEQEEKKKEPEEPPVQEKEQEQEAPPAKRRGRPRKQATPSKVKEQQPKSAQQPPEQKPKSSPKRSVPKRKSAAKAPEPAPTVEAGEPEPKLAAEAPEPQQAPPPPNAAEAKPIQSSNSDLKAKLGEDSLKSMEGELLKGRTEASAIERLAGEKFPEPRPQGRTKSSIKQSIMAQAPERPSRKSREAGQPVTENPEVEVPNPATPQAAQAETPSQPMMRGRKKSSFKAGQAGALALAGARPPSPVQKVGKKSGKAESGRKRANGEAAGGPSRKKAKKNGAKSNGASVQAVAPQEEADEEPLLEMTVLGNDVLVVGTDDEFHPGNSLVGKKVMKTFQGYLQRGSIVAFNADTKLYTVEYSGRGQEQLNWFLVEPILIIGADAELDPPPVTDLLENEATTYSRSFNITANDFEGI